MTEGIIKKLRGSISIMRTSSCVSGMKIKNVLWRVWIVGFELFTSSDINKACIKQTIKMWSWLEIKKRLNVVKRIKIAWQIKSPKQKWQLFFNFGKFFTDIVQIRIFSDCRIGWVAWIFSGIHCWYYSLVSYTVYFYISTGRVRECLLCFCFLGITTTVSRVFHEKNNKNQSVTKKM